METILKIRRLHFKEGLSQRQIAKKLQLNRRTIRKHLSTLSPPKYQRQTQTYPKLGEFIPFLEAFLIEELNKPSKEQLSVRRLFELLRSQGYQGQYNALTCFVRKFKEENVLSVQNLYIPQLVYRLR